MEVVAELVDLDEYGKWLRVGEKEKLESYLDIETGGSRLKIHKPYMFRGSEDLQEYQDLIEKVERKTNKSLPELIESAEGISKKLESKTHSYSDFDHSWKAIAKIPLGALGIATGIGIGKYLASPAQDPYTKIFMEILPVATFGVFFGPYLLYNLWEVNPIAVSSKKQLKKLLREEGIPGRLVRYFNELREIEVRI